MPVETRIKPQRYWSAPSEPSIDEDRPRIVKVESVSTGVPPRARAFVHALPDGERTSAVPFEVDIGMVQSVVGYELRAKSESCVSKRDRAVFTVLVEHPQKGEPGDLGEYELVSELVSEENGLESLLVDYECWHWFTKGFWLMGPKSEEVYSDWLERTESEGSEQSRPCVSGTVTADTDPKSLAGMVTLALSETKRFPSCVVRALSEEYSMVVPRSFVDCTVLGILSCVGDANVALDIRAGKMFPRALAVLNSDDDVVFVDLDFNVLKGLPAFVDAMQDLEMWHSTVCAGLTPRRFLRAVHLNIAGAEELGQEVSLDEVPFVLSPSRDRACVSPRVRVDEVHNALRIKCAWAKSWGHLIREQRRQQQYMYLQVWAASIMLETQPFEWVSLGDRSPREWVARRCEVRDKNPYHIQMLHQAREAAEQADTILSLKAQMRDILAAMQEGAPAPVGDKVDGTAQRSQVFAESSKQAAAEVDSEEDEELVVPLSERIAHDAKEDPAVLLQMLLGKVPVSDIRPLQFWSECDVEHMLKVREVPQSVPRTLDSIRELLGREHIVFACSLGPEVLKSYSSPTEALFAYFGSLMVAASEDVDSYRHHERVSFCFPADLDSRCRETSAIELINVIPYSDLMAYANRWFQAQDFPSLFAVTFTDGQLRKRGHVQFSHKNLAGQTPAEWSKTSSATRQVECEADDIKLWAAQHKALRDRDAMAEVQHQQGDTVAAAGLGRSKVQQGDTQPARTGLEVGQRSSSIPLMEICPNVSLATGIAPSGTAFSSGGGNHASQCSADGGTTVVGDLVGSVVCINTSCDAVLKADHQICLRCGFPHPSRCYCECGYPYNPNEANFCPQCRNCLPHSEMARKQVISSGSMARYGDAGDESSKSSESTTSKLRSKSYFKVLQRRRAAVRGPGLSVLALSSSSQLLSNLLLTNERYMLKGSLDFGTVYACMEGLSCHLTYDMMLCLSEGRAGPPGVGLSLWHTADEPTGVFQYWTPTTGTGKDRSKSTTAIKYLCDSRNNYNLRVANYNALTAKIWSQDFGDQVGSQARLLSFLRESVAPLLRDRQAPWALLLDLLDIGLLEHFTILKDMTNPEVSTGDLQRLHGGSLMAPLSRDTVPPFRILDTSSCPLHAVQMSAETFRPGIGGCRCMWTRAVEIAIEEHRVDAAAFFKERRPKQAALPTPGKNGGALPTPKPAASDNVTDNAAWSALFDELCKEWGITDSKIVEWAIAQVTRMLQNTDEPLKPKESLCFFHARGVPCRQEAKCAEMGRRHQVLTLKQLELCPALKIWMLVRAGGLSTDSRPKINKDATKRAQQKVRLKKLYTAAITTEDPGALPSLMDKQGTAEVADGAGAATTATKDRVEAARVHLEGVPDTINRERGSVNRKKCVVAHREMFGQLRVERKVEWELRWGNTSTAAAVQLCYTEYDLGERLQGYMGVGDQRESEVNRCESLATAACLRTSAKSIVDGLRRDGKRFRNEVMDVSTTADILTRFDEASADACRRELCCVDSVLGVSETLQIYHQAFMRQPEQDGVVVLHFVYRKNTATKEPELIGIDVAVPPSLLCDGVVKPNTPVVAKMYFEQHARLAVMKKMVLGGTTVTLSEDAGAITADWEGMCWKHFEVLREHLKARVRIIPFVALSINERKVPRSQRLTLPVGFLDVDEEVDSDSREIEFFEHERQGRWRLNSDEPQGRRAAEVTRECLLPDKEKQAAMAHAAEVSMEQLEALDAADYEAQPFSNSLYNSLDRNRAQYVDSLGMLAPPSSGVISMHEARGLVSRSVRAILALNALGDDGLYRPETVAQWQQRALLYENMVLWLPLAFPGDPSKILEELETVFKALESPGRAGPNLNPTVLEEEFKPWLDPEVYARLVRYVKFGVPTSLAERPARTTSAAPSRAALNNDTEVWRHLQTFSAQGWVHVFSPACRKAILQWCVHVCAIHYVADQDRLVYNGSLCSDFPSANELSEDLFTDSIEVQCDYIDIFVHQMMEIFAKLCKCDLTEFESRFSPENWVAFKADLKKAFLLLSFDAKSCGSIAFEFMGWVIVWRRMIFGWVYASHAFSVVSTAVKQRCNRISAQEIRRAENALEASVLRRHGERFGGTLEEDYSGVLLDDDDVRKFFVFGFIDDFLSVCLRQSETCATAMDVFVDSAALLCGERAVNVQKAEADGFIATVQQFTGAVVYTQRQGAALPVEKFVRLREILQENMDVRRRTLGLTQKVYGKECWAVRLYPTLRNFISGWRRALRGLNTRTTPKDTLVCPALPGEDVDRAMEKWRRDDAMIIEVCSHVEAFPEDAFVPFSMLLHPKFRYPLDGDLHCTGDACDYAVSAFNVSTREYLIVKVGTNLQNALDRARVRHGDKEAEAKDYTFLISLLELSVAPICQLQWGLEWKSKTVWMHTDNSNTASWISSGFSAHPIGQDMCRLIGAQEFVLQHRLYSWWHSTVTMNLADTASRRYDADGGVVQDMLDEFERHNSALRHKYKEVKPSDDVLRYVHWLHSVVDSVVDTGTMLHDVPLFASAMKKRMSAARENGKQVTATVVGSAAGTAASAEPPAKLSATGSHGSRASSAVPASLVDRGPAHRWRNAASLRQILGVCGVSAWPDRPTVACICSGMGLDMVAAVRAGFAVAWFVEIDPLKRAVCERIAGTASFANMMKLDLERLRGVMHVKVGPDCIDWSRAGLRRGFGGETGWKLWYVVFLLLGLRSLSFVIEISDFITKELCCDMKALLEERYYVRFDTLFVRHHRDPSHRARTFFVGFLRCLGPSAQTFAWPKHTTEGYASLQLKHLLEPDKAVHKDFWRVADDKRNEFRHTGAAKTVDWRRNGELGMHQLKLAIYGTSDDGKGHSSYNFPIYDREGLAWSGTAANGVGQIPMEDWVPGKPITATRYLNALENIRRAGLPDDALEVYNAVWAEHPQWHTSERWCDREHFIIHGVNSGVPIGTSYDIDVAVLDVYAGLAAAGVDLRRAAYGQAVAVTVARPMPHECFYGAGDADAHVDVLQPLHPTRGNKRAALGLGPLSNAERQYMETGHAMLLACELEKGTARAYGAGETTMRDLLQRMPLPSAAHKRTGVIFDPAVWAPSQVEDVLVQALLHEVFVRGNGLSAVNKILYGVRHINVRHGIDINLPAKLRLKQLLRALKKLRAPGQGKRVVTVGHLRYIRATLDVAESLDDLTVWAAVTVAFHFMCRASEYCATESRGSFDLDRALRRCDVVFRDADGCVMHHDFHLAKTVELCFGYTKNRVSGEKRTHERQTGELCVVQALGALCARRSWREPTEPLFAWEQGSTRAGEGVRYADMMALVKHAGQELGDDPADFATHSFRRGGLTAYLMAGVPYESGRIFGRWRSDAARRYIEPWAGLMQGAGSLVSAGHVAVPQQPSLEPREREVRLAEVRVQAATMNVGQGYVAESMAHPRAEAFQVRQSRSRLDAQKLWERMCLA